MNNLNGVLLHTPCILIVECVLCVPVRSLCIVYEKQVKLKFCIHDFDLIPKSCTCDVHVLFIIVDTVLHVSTCFCKE